MTRTQIVARFFAVVNARIAPVALPADEANLALAHAFLTKSLAADQGCCGAAEAAKHLAAAMEALRAGRAIEFIEEASMAVAHMEFNVMSGFTREGQEANALYWDANAAVCRGEV